CRGARNSITVSSTVRVGLRWIPRLVATVSHTASRSLTPASSHSQAPEGKSVTTSAATCTANRVFPTPPTPVNVTIGRSRTIVDTRVISTPRPTNDVTCLGRLPGVVVNDFGGGNSVGSDG